MIFVTLGTQDKAFPRLLDKIDTLIEQKIIQDEVIVQSGYTKYESNNMKIFNYVDDEEFNTYIDQCNLLITHGGVGCILSAITKDKKVIAIPRLKEYKEHVNNHQLEIINSFSKSGYILGCQCVDDLEKRLEEVELFTVEQYKSNNDAFCSMIMKEINQN